MAVFLSILALGFILGIKHATEPDHIIAVSTIASRTKKLSRSSMTGIFWGLGHSATLLVVGMIVIGLKQQISEQTAAFSRVFFRWYYACIPWCEWGSSK
ncbi:hypothetical protein GCM10020331_064510 [Ectobacillus funiculus]